MKNEQRKKSAKSRTSIRIRTGLSTLFLLIALGVLLYPIIANYLAAQQAVTSVQKFNQEVQKTSQTKVKQIIDDARLYNAKLYNQYVYDASQGIKFTGKIPDYNQTLDIDQKGMMGYISIPQIKVNDVPIYHGDAESTLAIGVGHLQQTSLPIGGINTHTVLAAHSGRVNDTLFTDLDKLKSGDVFYIHTLNIELKYEVINTKIVQPADVSTLSIIKGEDLATLVTCYPTGINNKRLLVTGKRIPLTQVTPSEKISRNKFGYDFWVLAGSSSLALLALLTSLLLLLAKRRRLYHVAQVVLKQPHLADGKVQGEFGAGFYLTTSKKLAQHQAQALEGAVINSYRFVKAKKGLKYLIYYKQTENWEKFVTANLDGQYEGKAHDYVKGPHHTPEIPVKRREMQVVLQSDAAFEHLKFIKSEQVK